MKDILEILFFIVCVLVLILFIMLAIAGITAVVLHWKDLINSWRDDDDRY